MNAEAQFLQSRQARRHVHLQHENSRTNVLQAFWSALKARLSRWKERLEALATKYDSHDEHVAFTEVNKRELCMELCRLEEELKRWKKLCLADSSIGDSPRNLHKDESDDDDFLSLCPPDLPLSDVRLLHTHFSDCQSRLDQVRKSLLPRGKFVFRRYREALLRQQEQDSSTLSTETIALEQASIVPSTNPRKRQEYDDPGRTISNQMHVQLLVHTDGRVERLVDSDDQNNAARKVLHQQQLASPLSFLLLKNLEHCQITIHGSYQSLHLVSVDSSQIRLTNRVEGAIHVTNCHHTSLWSQSQQLRLHDSTYLECHVQVSAGAILEDCTELVFYGSSSNDEDAAIVDVKDFNWLKKGIPSPNFRIQQVEDNEQDKATPPILPLSRRDNSDDTSHPTTDCCTPPIDHMLSSQAKNEEDEDEL